MFIASASMLAASTAHGRLEDAVREVLKAQGQLGGGEVEVDALLGRHGQVVVLDSVVSCAASVAPVRTVYWLGSGSSGGADLGAVLGELVVVLTIDAADEVQLLVQDASAARVTAVGVRMVLDM
jgi:hypothetical protein